MTPPPTTAYTFDDLDRETVAKHRSLLTPNKEGLFRLLKDPSVRLVPKYVWDLFVLYVLRRVMSYYEWACGERWLSDDAFFLGAWKAFEEALTSDSGQIWNAFMTEMKAEDFPWDMYHPVVALDPTYQWPWEREVRLKASIRTRAFSFLNLVRQWVDPIHAPEREWSWESSKDSLFSLLVAARRFMEDVVDGQTEGSVKEKGDTEEGGWMRRCFKWCYNAIEAIGGVKALELACTFSLEEERNTPDNASWLWVKRAGEPSEHPILSLHGILNPDNHLPLLDGFESDKDLFVLNERATNEDAQMFQYLKASIWRWIRREYEGEWDTRKLVLPAGTVMIRADDDRTLYPIPNLLSEDRGAWEWAERDLYWSPLFMGDERMRPNEWDKLPDTFPLENDQQPT